MSVDVEEVRARLCDPWALASALGLVADRRAWKRQARGVTVLCPWHDERSPSCSVTLGPDGTLRAHCFGCGASGDALGFVAAVHRLDARRDFRRVVEIAADLAGVPLEDTGVRPVPPRRAPPPEPPRLDDDTFDAIAAVIARRCPVASQPDVAGYLVERGLYEIGRGVLAALPLAGGVRGVVEAIVAEVGADAWLRSGLAREDGGLLFGSHRLVIFWRGPGVDGPVQTIQRRLVRPPVDHREPKYVFATRRQPRWPYGLEHAEALGPAGEVCFVEGALDALAMRALCARAGADRLVLGLPGTAGWSRPWAHLAEGRVAVVALDADPAGDAAVDALAQDLYAAGALAVHHERPDGAKDWAELLAREGAAA